MDYKKDESLARLIFGYPEISIETRGFKLIESIKTTSNKNQLTVKIIDFYSKSLVEIKADDKLRAKDFDENLSYWKNNCDWWQEFIRLKLSDDFINYALKSKDYKNRLATSHFITYKVFIPELLTFKKKAEEIIKDIIEL